MIFQLYYVEGLSVLDTPRFDTLEAQENYFDNHKIATVENSFYPPHYKNAIRFSVDDINFNSQVNYLSFNFMNKEYYYFISNMKYINESIFELEIDMDVIQTYMFDINFLSADMERLSIKRWTDDNKINRNYFRENLSVVDERNVIYQELDSENDCRNLLYYVVEMDSKASILTSSPNTFITQGIDTAYTPLRYFLLIIPRILSQTYTPSVILNDGTTEYTYNYTDALNLLDKLIDDPHTLSIKRLEKLPQPFNVTRVNNNYYVTSNEEANITGLEPYSSIKVFTLTGKIVHTDWTTYDYEFDFVKNTSKTSYFNKRYVPALMDENYYNFLFGERLQTTGIPLHLLQTTKLRCWYLPDLFSGIRIYKITEFLGTAKDIYMTQTQNTSLENMMLITDEYKDYMSRNESTLKSGILNAGLSDVYKTASLGIGAGINNAQLANTLKAHPRYRQSRVNMMKNATRLENLGNVSSGLLGSSLATELINQSALKSNLSHTPDSIKQGNNTTADILTDTLKIIIRNDEVKDIDKVAEEYEINGYKVSEYALNKNLFNDFNYRYYYNVIQASNITMSLKTLTSENILEAIQDRFSIGFRLWNVENLDNTQKFATFVYDNVETDYIEE